MAEYNFVVLDVRASFKEQSVFVNFSLDLDEDTISTERIYLLNQETKSIAPIKTIVDGRTLQIKLLDWAVPNNRYTLIIESGVGSISDEVTDTSLLQDLIFESEVVSEISIINPYNYQIYRNTIDLCWQEISSGKRANSYYIEISDDTGFHHIVRNTFIDMESDTPDNTDNDFRYKTSLAPLKDYGQYYIRMRAQDDHDNYGKWSKVITFDYLEPLPKKEDPVISPEEDSTTPSEQESPSDESCKKEGGETTPPSDPDDTKSESGDTLPDSSDEPGADDAGTSMESPEQPDAPPSENNGNDEDKENNTDKSTPDESEGETIIIEDLTETGKKPIILEDNDVVIQYEEMMDILPDEFFSVFYPIDIDISQAEFLIIRRDI